MSNGQQDDEAEYFSPKEVKQWADQELRDATKALELRKKELTELVTAYSAGQITPEQADERVDRYQHRWGESLRGCYATDTITDEEILAKIDSTRRPFVNARESREQFRRMFPKAAGDEGPTR